MAPAWNVCLAWHGRVEQGRADTLWDPRGVHAVLSCFSRTGILFISIYSVSPGHFCGPEDRGAGEARSPGTLTGPAGTEPVAGASSLHKAPRLPRGVTWAWIHIHSISCIVPPFPSPCLCQASEASDVWPDADARPLTHLSSCSALPFAHLANAGLLCARRCSRNRGCISNTTHR